MIGVQEMMGAKSFTWSALPEYVHVGSYSSIAAECFFHYDNHWCVFNPKFVSSWIFCQEKYPPQAQIEIGNDVWLGRGVAVLPGRKIGDGAIIGARAVVSKDVPPYAVVVGNPGVIKKFRFPPKTVEKLLKIKWWDWPEEVIQERLKDFEDVDKFVEKYYEHDI